MTAPRTGLLLRALIPGLALILGACSKAEDPADATDAAGDSAALRFTAIPDQKGVNLRPKFDAIARYLAAELGVEVEYLPVADYAGAVETFKNGDAQLGWFGGYTGVQARRAVPGARAIAQGEADPHFKSYFIAHADTGIEPSDEFPMALAGKSFAFGSQDSTSGRLMPEYFIRQATGQSPEEFFGGLPSFSKAHDKTAEWVSTGRVQAGALSFKNYDQLVAQGKIDPQQCRVVWITPEYADYNWTAHPVLEQRFGEGFVDRLQAALVGMDDPELLSAFPRERMIEARNEDFAAIEQTAIEVGMLR